jgi:hypothetical protein
MCPEEVKSEAEKQEDTFNKKLSLENGRNFQI